MHAPKGGSDTNAVSWRKTQAGFNGDDLGFGIRVREGASTRDRSRKGALVPAWRQTTGARRTTHFGAAWWVLEEREEEEDGDEEEEKGGREEEEEEKETAAKKQEAVGWAAGSAGVRGVSASCLGATGRPR